MTGEIELKRDFPEQVTETKHLSYGFDVTQCALLHSAFAAHSWILSIFQPETYRADPFRSGKRSLPNRTWCDIAHVLP